MALLALTAGLGTLAQVTQGSPDDPHRPIEIVGDNELRTNACGCIRNPGASGTPTDPFLIEDWRIDTSDTAILIKHIEEEHFVVRDNTLEGAIGVRLVDTGDRGAIVENGINFARDGVVLEDSSTPVRDNTIQGVHMPWPTGSNGVRVDGGSPILDDNFISQALDGIDAASSTPRIEDNEIADTENGIRLSASAEARIADNVLRLIDDWGVFVEDSAHARLISNEIREGQGGVVAHNAKLYMQNNTITNQRSDAVRFKKSVVQMFRNNVSDNWRGAFGSRDSDVVIRNNTFNDNGDGPGRNDNAGLRLDGSEGLVVNNQVDGNDVGIKVVDSIVELRDNTLDDNRWGISMPYGSKGSIPLMSGNVVNGVNVDGTENATEQRIFFEEVGVQISGKTIDSGHADDAFGTLFKQGALVVYDSQDFTIENNEFRYNDVALHVRGSSFVRVRSNVFLSNQEAVTTVDSRTFIKDNECDIEIDPPETVCFKAEGGFTTVRDNLAAHVAVGVDFNASAHGDIVGNDIRSTGKVGLRLEGSFDQEEHDVAVEDNRIDGNVVGALLVQFHGTFEANVVSNSTWAAVHLDERTNATFVENRVIFNARGVVDVGDCMDSFRPPCSTGVFVENEFKHNGRVGVHLKDGGSFDGDVFVDNKVGARIEGEARMEDIEARANSRLGVRVEGSLDVRDANVSANGKHGLRVVGALEADNLTASRNDGDGIRAEGQAHLRATVAQNNSQDGLQLEGSGRVRDANFSGNGKAGMRLGGTLFVVNDCEASFNLHGVVVVTGQVDVSIRVPVPEPPEPPEPRVPDIDNGGGDDGDPLWMHECDIVGNEEFALRANVEARVNATQNFWGKAGPKIDTPLLAGDNVVSANARVSPYFQTRAHETQCLVPSTEVSTGTPQGCIEA